MRPSRFNSATVFAIGIVIVSMAGGCGKKKKNDDSDTSVNGVTPSTSPDGTDTSNFKVAGTINLAVALSLTGEAANVTNVVALNPSTGASVVADVQSDGTFELPISTDKPWVISYIDNTKTGADMIV